MARADGAGALLAADQLVRSELNWELVLRVRRREEVAKARVPKYVHCSILWKVDRSIQE